MMTWIVARPSRPPRGGPSCRAECRVARLLDIGSRRGGRRAVSRRRPLLSGSRVSPRGRYCSRRREGALTAAAGAPCVGERWEPSGPAAEASRENRRGDRPSPGRHCEEATAVAGWARGRVRATEGSWLPLFVALPDPCPPGGSFGAHHPGGLTDFSAFATPPLPPIRQARLLPPAGFLGSHPPRPRTRLPAPERGLSRHPRQTDTRQRQRMPAGASWSARWLSPLSCSCCVGGDGSRCRLREGGRSSGYSACSANFCRPMPSL